MGRREITNREPRPVWTLRLGSDERRLLEAAAGQRGVPLSTYVRGAALRAARAELVADETLDLPAGVR